jgi:formylglycine-generating enzyme required for sulfatase activity
MHTPLLKYLAAVAFFMLAGSRSNAQVTSYAERIGKETDIDMILVRGGTFEMGCNDREEERPKHNVSLNSYYIGKYEITQQQWDAVMVFNLSHHSNCPKCPVDAVSWADAQQFLRKLGAMTGKRYRLPTEAEWEYAAKGGQKSEHYKYSGSNNINLVGWVYSGPESYDRKTYPVGLKQPNELGIYDMTGNVMEMCNDWYDSAYYKQKVTNNPKGPASGRYKVYRGGSYINYPQYATITYRDNEGEPDTTTHWVTLGFRIVRDCAQ